MNVQSTWTILGPKRWLGLAAWVMLSFSAASVGAPFMPGAWYAELNKPWWNPPSWIFGPVWTGLYMMMATAAWLVWQRGGFAVQRRTLSMFLAQLALNSLWTPLFFGLKWPGVAFAEIGLLWLAITATVLAFRSVSHLAAVLLMPYLTWVSFAALLNFTLWRLNP